MVILMEFSADGMDEVRLAVNANACVLVLYIKSLNVVTSTTNPKPMLMPLEILRDSMGNVIAEIRQQGSNEVIFSPSGATLGWYNPNTNTTYDASGNTYGVGNLLTRLIR